MKIGLIGATNAGKSTLFNRLIGQFRAIVTDIPGTTRDIIKHRMELENGDVVMIFDSPGLLDFSDEVPYITQIVQDSDLLLFLIDDSAGITAKEQYIMDIIRTEKKSDATILIVNKLDIKWKESETDLALADYYSLGFSEVLGISAKNERNLDQVQDVLVKKYKQRFKEHPDYQAEPEEERVGLAIIGKPNAWKSTLLNTLVGENLAIVSDVSGTTRDYVAGEFEYKGKKFIAYDTAGIKKKGKVHGIEKIAYDKTLSMLEYTRPVVIFMVDCTQGITHRDMTLLQEIHRLSLPIIFALNKVDQVNPKGINAMIQNTQTYLEFAKYIPIVPMCALKGDGIEDVMRMVAMLQKENMKRITTRELNKALQLDMIQRPPRFPKNKICKILYATQIAVDAPTFIVFVNHKSRVNFSFKKRVENVIRKNFGFIGVPIVIKYRNRGENGNEGTIQVNYNEQDAKEYTLKDSEIWGGNIDYDEYEDDFSESERENPYSNKGKRKREKKGEKSDSSSRTSWKQSKSSSTLKKTREKPKREGKYFNAKKGDQRAIDRMFAEAYGEKNQKKKKRW